MALMARGGDADSITMSERAEASTSCDRCDEPATVISPIGRLCSKHAREEAERDAEALRRRRGPRPK